MRLKLALAVAIAGYTTHTIAQTERDLDSHEHGSALLNVALDDKSLFIELESPWNNFVGFEHAPSTEEQHKLVDDTLAALNQPEQLFAFDGGGCQVAQMTVESDMEGEHGDEHHDEHGHDDDHKDEHHDEHKHEHGHDDDHKDEHHDEHKHEHDDDHKDEHHDHAEKDDHDHDHSAEGETHSSVLASYTFTCDDPSGLAAIDVTLLDRWSGFEDLDVQLAGPGGQGGAELGQQNIRLDMKAVQ